MSWRAFIILACGAFNIKYLQRGGIPPVPGGIKALAGLYATGEIDLRNRRSICSGKQALYTVVDCSPALTIFGDGRCTQ